VKLTVVLGERGATLAEDPTEDIFPDRNRRLVKLI
jgi:hypothetical protein